MDSIKISLDNYEKITEEQIIDILTRVGEEFFESVKLNSNIQGGPFKQRRLTPKEAKSGKKVPAYGNYLDDTTNLRSSSGYFILKNGLIIQKKMTGSTEGISEAESIVSMLDNFEGYRLVGIAGMNYASFVESKGYNVISSQKEVAIIALKEYFSYVT